MEQTAVQPMPIQRHQHEERIQAPDAPELRNSEQDEFLDQNHSQSTQQSNGRKKQSNHLQFHCPELEVRFPDAESTG